MQVPRAGLVIVDAAAAAASSNGRQGLVAKPTLASQPLPGEARRFKLEEFAVGARVPPIGNTLNADTRQSLVAFGSLGRRAGGAADRTVCGWGGWFRHGATWAKSRPLAYSPIWGDRCLQTHAALPDSQGAAYPPGAGWCYERSAMTRTPNETMVVDDVAAFIGRLSPEAVCDDCIADRLVLSVRQQANHETRGLAASGGFERKRAKCSLCGADKLVIRRT